MTPERTYRIGQIVPSSNVTMEREIPAMLRLRETILPERFSFHSARMRMKSVTKEELEAMDGNSDRCALELSDARVDVLGYACLVAIMAMGKGYHRSAQTRLQKCTAANDAPAPVVTSAGALIHCLQLMKAKRIALIAPYALPLTRMVVDYIESEGILVKDFVALEIEDNLAVGGRDPLDLLEIYRKLDPRGIDALVLSACVQMPSLAAVQVVENECGIPVMTAATATAHQLLAALGLRAMVPNAGQLLSGTPPGKPD